MWRSAPDLVVTTPPKDMHTTIVLGIHAHTLVTVALLMFSWLVLVRPQLTSRSRRLSFDAGIIGLSVLFLVKPHSRLMILLPQLSWAVLGAYVIASSGASAVIIIELLRVVVARWRGWSDRIHFRIVVALWLLLMLVQVIFFAIARSRLYGAARQP